MYKERKNIKKKIYKKKKKNKNVKKVFIKCSKGVAKEWEKWVDKLCDKNCL